MHRIKENYKLEKYNKIYGYGDSSGDKDLLALADESFYKPFRD
jgi:phosphoserine phosphatase